MGVLSPVIWVISIVTLLITPLITTHEPPSRVHKDLGFRAFRVWSEKGRKPEGRYLEHDYQHALERAA